MLTDEAIADHLERARRQVCLAHDPGCFAFPYTPEDAAGTMTRDGWVQIGWIAADHARRTWNVWLNEGTGEGRLRPTSGGTG